MITQIDLNPDATERFNAEFDVDAERARAGKASAGADALGALLTSRWHEWAEARREKEEEWLYCLRAFNAQTEPVTGGDSRPHAHIYMGITRTKVISAYARMLDLLFQASDPHWGIAPTPVPNLEEQLKTQIKQQVLATVPGPLPIEQYQAMVDALAARERKAIDDEANLRADAMAKTMEDQLLDMAYEDAAKWGIFQGCLLGTGAIKGIIPDSRQEQHWSETPLGWDLLTTEVKAPKLSQVSVFDLYPDPYAQRIDDAVGVFERHVMNRRQFADLREVSLFDRTKINEILAAQASRGSYTPLYHETERHRIAGNNVTMTRTDRFDVLEYWGVVPGDVLITAGVDLPEEAEPESGDAADPATKMFWVNVWVCSGKTLLARLSPLKRQRVPYHFFSFFRSTEGFWGVGVAWMMKHSQSAMNGLVQAMLDNASAASGPQAEINVHMLAVKDRDTKFQIKPWGVWLRDAGDPAIPAVRFFQPQSNVGDLQALADLFRKNADEETSMPSYTHGEQIPGLNKTAAGTSMLMTAANVTLKAVIKSLEDGLIRPLLQSLFDWNMEWNSDPNIKGDLDVNVRASSALIAKEMQSQRLIQFAELTANPLDLQFIDREKLLREIAQAMDLNPDKIWRDDDQSASGNGVQFGQPPGVGSVAGVAGGAPAEEQGPTDVAQQQGGAPPVAGPMLGAPAVAGAA